MAHSMRAERPPHESHTCPWDARSARAPLTRRPLLAWTEAVRLAPGLQVRSQLEVLLAEKAALAAENERLAHQNCGLQELLQYSMQARIPHCGALLALRNRYLQLAG